MKVSARVDGRLVSTCVASRQGEHTVALRFEDTTGSLAMPSSKGMAAFQLIARELDRDPTLATLVEDVARDERATGIRTAAQLTLQRLRATRG